MDSQNTFSINMNLSSLEPNKWPSCWQMRSLFCIVRFYKHIHYVLSRGKFCNGLTFYLYFMWWLLKSLLILPLNGCKCFRMIIDTGELLYTLPCYLPTLDCPADRKFWLVFYGIQCICSAEVLFVFLF